MRRGLSRVSSEIVFLSAFTLSLTAKVGVCHAANPLAEALYQEGKRLMAEQRYPEACPKFRESHRLDAGLGTLLNLAACHEKEGKLATAWTEYHEAAAWARRTAEHDRATFADQQIALLQPRLSYLTISTSDGSLPADLEVRLNGREIGAAAFGLPTPLDRGAYLVEARAPGKKPFIQNVALLSEGQKEVLTIAPLENAPLPVPRLRAAEPAPRQKPTPRGRARERRITRERPIGGPTVISAGVSVALGIGAGVTGLLYLDRRAAFLAANEDPLIARSEREDLRATAKTQQILTGALTGAAIGGVVVTAYLYLTRPEKTPAQHEMAIQPLVGVGFGGVRIRWGAH